MTSKYRHKWGQEEDDRCRNPQPMGNPSQSPKGAMIVCRWCGHELICHGQKVKSS